MPAKVSATKKVITQTKKTSSSSSRSGTTSRVTRTKASNPKSSSTVKQTQNVDRFVKSTPKPNPGTYSRPASSNPGVRREREQAEQKQKAREAQLSNPISHNVALRKEATRGEHDDKIAKQGKKELAAEKFVKTGDGVTAVKVTEAALAGMNAASGLIGFAAGVAKIICDGKSQKEGKFTIAEEAVYNVKLSNDCSTEELAFSYEHRKEIDEFKESHRKIDEANGNEGS